MQKILLSTLLGLSLAAPIALTRAQNPDDWGLNDCPEMGDLSGVIGRSIDTELEQRWRRILPPGATLRRCWIGDRPVVMVGLFRDWSIAERHAARVRREIIQPYYHRKIRESISIQGGE